MKFTKEEQLRIITEYESGMSLKKLGQLKSCSHQTICNILIKNNIKRLQGGRPSCKNHTILSVFDKQVIEGLLLGDGCISIHPMGVTPSLRLGTVESSMASHIIKISPLKIKYCTKPIREVVIMGRRCTACEIYECYSNCDLSLIDFRKKWYPDGIKIIPEDLILSPVSVKYWFYGDGCSDYRKNPNGYDYVRVTFYTNGFSWHDCELLQLKLKKIGLDFNINKKNNNPTLTTSKIKVVKKFFEYIGRCDVSGYQYKWKEV